MSVGRVEGAGRRVRIYAVRFHGGTSEIHAKLCGADREAAEMMYDSSELVRWAVESRGRRYRGEAVLVGLHVGRSGKALRYYHRLQLRVSGPIRSRALTGAAR